MLILSAGFDIFIKRSTDSENPTSNFLTKFFKKFIK